MASNNLEHPAADLPDDDPDMIAGMERLRVLRACEEEISDLQSRVPRRLRWNPKAGSE